MLRERVEKRVLAVLRGRYPEGDLSGVRVEAAREKDHGDLAVNAALLLAKPLRRPPREIAAEIAGDLEKDPLFRRVEIAGPGFINLFLHAGAYHDVLARVIEKGRDFGRAEGPRRSRQQIEFVSANPTGPLNVVSARAAAVGDTLARLLEATGIEVDREFYVNDQGSQVSHLAETILWYREGAAGDFPAEGYRGEYVRDLARESERVFAPLVRLDESGAADDDIGPIVRASAALASGEAGPAEEAARAVAGTLPAPVTREAFREILRVWAVEKMIRSQRETFEAFSVRYRTWFRESELHFSGEVEETLAELDAAGHVYEKEGARWFRSTAFGDDEDRVIVRGSGEPTYFLADIAYHRNKGKRGYDRVIDILGPDHHGHIPRMMGAVSALGKEEGWLEIMIIQQVNLLRGGEVVKMSKRAGEFVTLDDLIAEVGTDAARFFFLRLRPNTHLNFDLDLAKSKTMDNPVYYVQYAHARICSVFEHARAAGVDSGRMEGVDLGPLAHEGEIDLLRTLDAFPDTVEMAAATREPQRIPAYLQDLAAKFHTYYHKAKIVTDDESVTRARLALVGGVRTVIRNGLDLLGVGAPEAM
ncbi:MAG: arginine--tRNA ligase [Candidatus Eisenbacteria bacterium]